MQRLVSKHRGGRVRLTDKQKRNMRQQKARETRARMQKALDDAAIRKALDNG